MKNAMGRLPDGPGHLPNQKSYLVFELTDSIALVHAM
jgi:hypothetical protein